MEKSYCSQGHPAHSGNVCPPCEDEHQAMCGQRNDCTHVRDFRAQLLIGRW